MRASRFRRACSFNQLRPTGTPATTGMTVNAGLVLAASIAAAMLAASTKPALTVIPVVAGVPVGLSWLKLQARLKRDARIDKLGNS